MRWHSTGGASHSAGKIVLALDGMGAITRPAVS